MKVWGSRELTLRTPNGSSWPSMATLRLLTMPSPVSVGDGVNRVSAAMSSVIGRLAAAQRVQRALGVGHAERQPVHVGDARGHAHGGDRDQALAGAVQREHAADVDAERLGRGPHHLAEQRDEVVALQREAAEARDRVLLERPPREVLRGMGALADVARHDEQRLDRPVLSPRTGTAWTEKVSPSLWNSKVRRSPLSAAR